MEAKKDNSQFRAMLVNIHYSLSTAELKTLIFFAEIKRKLAETIQQPTDLFQILEERGDLKPNNLNKFRELIGVLETRRDLLEIIDGYVKETEMVDGNRRYYPGGKYPNMLMLQAADGDLKQKEDILENQRDVIERKGREGQLKEENKQLKEEVEQLKEEVEQLKEENKQLKEGNKKVKERCYKLQGIRQQGDIEGRRKYN